jgi:ABC-type glycerol-3-phosphate transport system substrate-binding protein
MKLKPSFLVVSLLLLIVIGIHDASAGGEQEQSAAVPAKITVTMLPGVLQELVTPFLADFEAENNIEVELALLPFAELRSKVLTELVTGTARYDVVLVSELWMGEFGDHLEALDAYLKNRALMDPNYDFEDIIPGSLAGGSYQDKQVGIPWRDAARMLFWNREMFNDAGLGNPPNTWNELLDMAEKLTRDVDGDGSIDIWGFGLQGEAGWAASIEFQSVLLSYGASLLNNNATKAAFNSPEGVEALAFYTDLIRTNKVAPPECVTWNWDPLITALQQGKIATTVAYSPYAGLMDDPDKSEVVGQIHYALCPKKETTSTIGAAWQYCIPSKAQNKEAGFKFIQYFTSKDVQLEQTKLGNSPVRFSVYENNELASKRRDFEAAKQALATSKRLPPIPELTEIMDIFGRAVNEALTGTKAPVKALADAEESVNKLLQK